MEETKRLIEMLNSESIDDFHMAISMIKNHMDMFDIQLLENTNLQNLKYICIFKNTQIMVSHKKFFDGEIVIL